MAIREFQLERYFARWEFTAPHLLSASDCETMSVGELLAMADMPLSTLADLRLGYTESQGDPALRTTIADFYSHITPDDVLYQCARGGDLSNYGGPASPRRPGRGANPLLPIAL